MPSPKTRSPAGFRLAPEVVPAVALAVLLALATSSCGYRGPLYLPQEDAGGEVPTSSPQQSDSDREEVNIEGSGDGHDLTDH